jgi:hypothetical protein
MFTRGCGNQPDEYHVMLTPHDYENYASMYNVCHKDPGDRDVNEEYTYTVQRKTACNGLNKADANMVRRCTRERVRNAGERLVLRRRTPCRRMGRSRDAKVRQSWIEG